MVNENGGLIVPLAYPRSLTLMRLRMIGESYDATAFASQPRPRAMEDIPK
jgi:hypothetical protein